MNENVGCDKHVHLEKTLWNVLAQNIFHEKFDIEIYFVLFQVNTILERKKNEWKKWRKGVVEWSLKFFLKALSFVFW